jgi:hypothetical protein
VFLSLSFMRWRKLCMVSFLSVMTVRRRFINMAEQLSAPRSLATMGNTLVGTSNLKHILAKLNGLRVP